MPKVLEPSSALSEMTGKQIAIRLGVKRSTLGRWRTTNRLKARICNDRGEWL
jgi:hypothetical protein